MSSRRTRVALAAAVISLVMLAACNKNESTAATAAADVPSECDAYIKKVTACMDKLGANNASASMFKQQLDSARAQWTAIPDKTQLNAQCKQSADLFAQSSTQMGCQ
jgi:hypothetical protein